MIELMKQYNHLISRYYKAIDFFQKNPEQIDKYIQQHRELINNLDSLRTQIITAGYAMTDDETLNGFRQIQYMEV
jgi:hypothetical protein